MNQNENKNEPITVELSTEKKCYICGRSPDDLELLLDVNNLKMLISQPLERLKSQIEIKKSEIEPELKAYVDSLEQLYADTENYQGDLTIQELSNNNLAMKIAPKYKELSKFIPDEEEFEIIPIPPRSGYNQYERDQCTIDQLRWILNKMIQELNQCDYSSLKKYEPKIYSNLQEIAILTPITQDPKLFRIPKFAKVKLTKYVDLKGNEIEGEEKLDPKSRKREINYYVDNPEAEKDFEKPKKIKLNPNEIIIKINLTYYMCFICADAFKKASRAAYSVIHEEIDDDD